MSMIALVDLTTWFWLLYCSLCTFLFMSRKCLNMSVLSTVQPFGYLLMKYSLSPESGSALLQPLGIRAARGLLRWADCYCDELLSLLILTRAWLSPRHFPVWLLMPGPSAEYAWATPGLSSCPFDVFRVIPQPKPGTATVAFASSPIVWEGPRTSANIFSCSLQHMGKGCLQAGQWIWWDVWHQALTPFWFIHPVGPTRMWWCCCPDNGWFPLQMSFSLPHFFDGSNFCQQVALSSPSHCKKEGHVCSVKKLLPACREVLRSSCGCAVTHISRESDVS